MGTALSSAARARVQVLDTALVECARGIKVLSALAWPPELATQFLASWERGSPEIPLFCSTRVPSSEATRVLGELIGRCDVHSPLERFISASAESYVQACSMLEVIGTPMFTALSKQLYGEPRDHVGQGSSRIIDVAEKLIAATDSFTGVCAVSKADYCVLPQVVAAEMRRTVDRVFTAHPVEIVIDSTLASKAASGARRIRIRGGTCFSWDDIPELIHHEALVHTLTMLNGREQPLLKSLGLGAPRTTLTQEGLAIFAEFITNSMSLARLRRIALRVKAIHLALEGADFVQLFRFFLDSGQDEVESFYSTMRIFRGGDLSGKIVFTKDVVYLRGLLLMHSFLLEAIREGHVEYPHLLFAGRLTSDDVAELAPFFADQTLARPLYEPEWIKNRHKLAAFLLYSNVLHTLLG